MGPRLKKLPQACPALASRGGVLKCDHFARHILLAKKHPSWTDMLFKPINERIFPLSGLFTPLCTESALKARLFLALIHPPSVILPIKRQRTRATNLQLASGWVVVWLGVGRLAGRPSAHTLAIIYTHTQSQPGQVRHKIKSKFGLLFPICVKIVAKNSGMKICREASEQIK